MVKSEHSLTPRRKDAVAVLVETLHATSLPERQHLPSESRRGAAGKPHAHEVTAYFPLGQSPKPLFVLVFLRIRRKTQTPNYILRSIIVAIRAQFVLCKSSPALLLIGYFSGANSL